MEQRGQRGRRYGHDLRPARRGRHHHPGHRLDGLSPPLCGGGAALREVAAHRSDRDPLPGQRRALRGAGVHLRGGPDNLGIATTSFVAVLGASTFHLYDDTVRSLVEDFARHLHETTRFGHRYDSKLHSDDYVFTYSTDSKTRKREETDWGDIEKELDLLRRAMHNLIQYLKTNYVELDVEDLSDRAWKRYMQMLHPEIQ